MFKGFNKSSGFASFPEHNFKNRSKTSYQNIYGKEKGIFRLDAAEGIPSGIVSGNLLPSWNDLVFGSYFVQPDTLYQPRWIASDATFGGLPVVECHTKGRGLYEHVRQGPVFGAGQTLALVYQYMTAGGSNPYPHSLVVGHYETFWNPRYDTFGYNWQTVTTITSGYCRGTQYAPNQKSAASIYDSTVRIVVISKSGFVSNGAIVTPTINALTGGGILNAIGGAGYTNSGGVFKLSEVVLWTQDFDDAQCLEICTELNSKYAIY